MRLRKTCCNELGTAYLPIPAAHLCACCCRDDVSHSGEKIDWGQWAITGNDPEFGGTGNPDTGDDYGPAPGALTTSQLLRVILGVLYPDICPCSQPPAVIISLSLQDLVYVKKSGHVIGTLQRWTHDLVVWKDIQHVYRQSQRSPCGTVDADPCAVLCDGQIWTT